MVLISGERSVSKGLLEKPNDLGILSFKKDDLIKSGFGEFDHGIGARSYDKSWLLYGDRQVVCLTVFFKPDEESFYHLQFEFGKLRLYRFLKKYFLYLTNNHNLTFYKATDREFSECYAIKTDNSIIHFTKDSARESLYIRKIESINERLTGDDHSSVTLDLFENQFSPFDSLTSACNHKKLKLFLDSIID